MLCTFFENTPLLRPAWRAGYYTTKVDYSAIFVATTRGSALILRQESLRIDTLPRPAPTERPVRRSLSTHTASPAPLISPFFFLHFSSPRLVRSIPKLNHTTRLVLPTMPPTPSPSESREPPAQGDRDKVNISRCFDV